MKHDFESEQQHREETWRPSDQPTEDALKVDERAPDIAESGQHAPGYDNQQDLSDPDNSNLADSDN